MARLYDPTTWLEKNAKPSWKISIWLGPMHHDDDAHSKVESEQHDITGEEAHRIEQLWRHYEDNLPDAGRAIGIDDLNLADVGVTVRIPQRNGGNIKFRMTYDHQEDSWFDCYNPPDSPLDKPIQFADLKLLGKKKPTKKSAPRKTRR